MPPGQRGAYQRALSMDAKPMGAEGAMGGGLAGRRNVPCPTLIKQENMDASIRPGALPNGFLGGMNACPPRGNPISEFLTLHDWFSLKMCSSQCRIPGIISFSHHS